MADVYYQFKTVNSRQNGALLPYAFFVLPFVIILSFYPPIMMLAHLVASDVAMVVSFFVFGVLLILSVKIPPSIFKRKYIRRYLNETVVFVSNDTICIQTFDEQHTNTKTHKIALNRVTGIGVSRWLLPKGKKDKLGNPYVFHKLCIEEDGNKAYKLMLTETFFGKWIRGKDIEQFGDLCRRLVDYRNEINSIDSGRVIRSRVPVHWIAPVRLILAVLLTILVFIVSVFLAMALLYLVVSMGTRPV